MHRFPHVTLANLVERSVHHGEEFDEAVPACRHDVILAIPSKGSHFFDRFAMLGDVEWLRALLIEVPSFHAAIRVGDV